jgi:polyhydroxyalkanoate synthesis regulator protein
MGDFLEKSASSVIGMQEELRKQAMQMFSSFPYNAPPPPQTSKDAEPESDAPPSPRAKTRRTK